MKLLFMIIVCSALMSPVYGEGYHNKILASDVTSWKEGNHSKYEGIYTSVDFDDTLEEYYYIKAFVDEADQKWISIIKVKVAVIMDEPSYVLTKGKILQKDKFTEVKTLEGDKMTFITYKDPVSKKKQEALKVGDFVYRKDTKKPTTTR